MLKPFLKEKNNYTLYGALFGFLFPLGATIFESIHTLGSLTWDHALQVQRENVLLWIIDSAPFWLGVFARLGGIRQDMVLEQKRMEVLSFSSFPTENPFPVMRISWSGKILFYNRPGLDFLEEWGRSIEGIIPEPFLEPLREIQSGRPSALVEVKSGSRLLLFHLVAMPEMQYVNAYSTDITEIKKMESDLVLAKEKAERGDRAKTEFLAKMSHELRTPMNAILGFTQLLQMESPGKLDSRQMENLNRIYSAGEHLLELINDVLDLSQVESGKLEMSIQPVEVGSLIGDVADISRPLVERFKVDLEYEDRRDNPCFVMADSLRLKQVILNLVSNGVKYNKPGGKVAVTCAPQGEGKIRLEVRDTGNGIPEDMKGELFKPFKRFDPNSERIEGTGIGLAICRQLVELMGGDLQFESVLGEGSRFYFDLHLCEDAPGTPFRERTPHSSSCQMESS